MLSHDAYMDFLKYIDLMVANNGPDEEDYFTLADWAFRIKRAGGLTEARFKEVFPKVLWAPGGMSLFNRICTGGRVVGTYDIMHEIHTGYVDPLLTLLEYNWDKFIQSQICAVAVRHRPLELTETLDKFGFVPTVLDVACGSGMGAEACKRSGTLFNYLGMDSDEEAITFCEKQWRNTPGIKFCQGDIRHANPNKLGKFNLVWCSGLFDYFSTDRVFINAARKLLSLSSREVVIGNMGPANLGIPMMELLGWKLHYRTKHQLAEIATQMAGNFDESSDFTNFEITTDPTGVQHYLHLYK